MKQRVQHRIMVTDTLDHEMRNAIMPLLLHLDLLDLHSTDEHRRTAPGSRPIIENLQRLTNGLLLRAAERAATTAPESIHLTDWWQTVGPLLRRPLPIDCALQVRIPRSLPPVFAHPAVLAQVLLHLMVHLRLGLSAEGPHRVRITARATLRGVTLNISDGVPCDRSPGVAGTAPAASTRDWGLIQARALLAHSDASLSGQGETEHGTNLTIRLQAAGTVTAIGIAERASADREERASQLPAARTAVAPRTPTSPAEKRALTVLMIDDNTALTGALALRFGLESGIECLPPIHVLRDTVAQIMSLGPTLVLLDLNLPGDEQPNDVIRSLKERGSTARVIILTGNPSTSAVNAARDAGAAGFIAKGVVPERLIAALHRAVQGDFVVELDR